MFHLLLEQDDRRGAKLRVVSPIKDDENCAFSLELPDCNDYIIYRLRFTTNKIRHEKITKTHSFLEAKGICADIYSQRHGHLPESRSLIEPVKTEQTHADKDDFLSIHYKNRLYTFPMSKECIWD